MVHQEMRSERKKAGDHIISSQKNSLPQQNWRKLYFL